MQKSERKLVREKFDVNYQKGAQKQFEPFFDIL